VTDCDSTPRLQETIRDPARLDWNEVTKVAHYYFAVNAMTNPIIADVFYKTGLIEKWGRGTNRVIEMSIEAGIAPPKFEEITGAAVVTFKVNVRGPQQTTDQVVGRLGTDAVPSRDQVGTKSGLS